MSGVDRLDFFRKESGFFWKEGKIVSFKKAIRSPATGCKK